MAAYLAGVVVREMGLGILRGDSGKQEGPPLLANAVMVVGPVSRGCLHHTMTHVRTGFTVQQWNQLDQSKLLAVLYGDLACDHYCVHLAVNLLLL